jgi:hypothetical protein
VNTVENFKITRCPAGCGACPDVELVGDEIRIGEAGNLAVLKRDEWNLLVDLIQGGRPFGRDAGRGRSTRLRSEYLGYYSIT